MLNPPLADVSGKLSLSNIDPIPLITICPFNQINESKVKYLGYDKTTYFLKGVKDIDGEQHLTWGSDINKTFEELLEFVVDISTENYSGLHVNELKDGKLLRDRYNGNLKKRFYIGNWGYCWDLEEYDITTAIEISFEPTREFKSMKTYYGIYEKSLVGQSILTSSENRNWYEISIQIVSHLDPNDPDNCVEYKGSMFEKCTEEKIHMFTPEDVMCNIPWLSANNPCAKIMKTKENVKEYMSHLNQFVYNDYIAIEDECVQPCNSTIITPRLRKMYDDYPYKIKISFEKELTYTNKIMTYGPVKFIVDIGKNKNALAQKNNIYKNSAIMTKKN